MNIKHYLLLNLALTPLISNSYQKLENHTVKKATQAYYSSIEILGLQPKPDYQLSQIDTLLNQYAEQNNLPKQLLHGIALTESNKTPFLTSSKGAIGLMQIMPMHLKACNLKAKSELYDVEKNIKCSAQLLKELNAQTNGKLPDILCRYNSGKPCSTKSPQETKNYLIKFLENLNLT